MLALFGTFFGVYFAFRLNENKDKEKVAREQKAALNRAIFILGRQYNSIRNYKKHLDMLTTDFDKIYKLPNITCPQYCDIKQNLHELVFLLETSNHQIMMTLLIEQDCFDLTLECIRARNNFWLNEFQPELKRLIDRGLKLTHEQLPTSLDVRINSEAKSTSEQIYENVNKSIQSIPKVHQDLLTVAHEIFPNEKFIRFD